MIGPPIEVLVGPELSLGYELVLTPSTVVETELEDKLSDDDDDESGTSTEVVLQ